MGDGCKEFHYPYVYFEFPRLYSHFHISTFPHLYSLPLSNRRINELANYLCLLVQHILHQQHLWLLPSRCIFWEEQQALILSDLHLGKTGHFRKYGIAVPQTLYKEDLQRLFTTITDTRARRLIIVGDLFHSESNLELDLFRRWRDDLPTLAIDLIKGNHDILRAGWYHESGITVHDELLKIDPFLFRHDPAANADADSFCFSGHIHPGVRIQGPARQALHFPCFYFGAQRGILPAYSRFTGTQRVRPETGDAIFAIVENTVLKIS